MLARNYLYKVQDSSSIKRLLCSPQPENLLEDGFTIICLSKLPRMLSPQDHIDTNPESSSEDPNLFRGCGSLGLSSKLSWLHD